MDLPLQNSMNKEQEFTRLVKPLGPQIQAFTRYLAWSQNDVEDIFQHALMTAYQKFDDFSPGTNFKVWLFKFITLTAFNVNRKHEKITANEVLMEAEWIGREDEIDTFLEDSKYDEFLKNPDLILDSVSDHVRTAVLKMPGRRRGIFLLCTAGELKYKEIAEIMQIPVGTVMGELFRARKFLREELKEMYQNRYNTYKEGGANYELGEN